MSSNVLINHGWRPQVHLCRHRKKLELERTLHKLIRPLNSMLPKQKAPLDAKTTHIFRADNTNIGDWYSPPCLYFPFFDYHHVLDVNKVQANTPLASTIILGGGGLIGPAFRQVEEIIRRPGITSVGWGLGNNMIDNKRQGYIEKTAPLPDYAKHFTLLGIRDADTPFRWVPCASCMHPAFSKEYPVSNEVVIYEHKRLSIAVSGFPRMSNTGCNIDRAVAFLGSAKLVLTNSYHGAYWATLLGKRCIAVPFSSKFFGFKHSIPLCQSKDWRAAEKDAVAYPNALRECRKANVDFFHDVMTLAYTQQL